MFRFFKNIKLLLLSAFLIMSSFFCCNKTEKVDICCCEDSLTEMLWLKNIVNNIENKKSNIKIDIFSYLYKGKTLIKIDKNINTYFSNSTIYDCNGKLICDFNREDELYAIPDFKRIAKQENLLYSNYRSR